MSEYTGPRRGELKLHPNMTPELAQRIGDQLIRLHRNTLIGVPVRHYVSNKRSKVYMPLRKRCDRCPKKGKKDAKGGYVSAWRLCSEASGQAEYDRVRGLGYSEHECNAAKAAAIKFHQRAHLESESNEFWYAHVQGWHLREYDDGREPDLLEFHRGAYSHFNLRSGSPSGFDVIWDLDDKFPGKTPIQLAGEIASKLNSVGLTGYFYCNRTHGGTGVHVRLSVVDRVPSWLRERFGKELLLAIGYRPGGDPSKGQIESFPKQKGGGELGNLVGLPCSAPMMMEGKTNLLDLNWQPIYDLEHTARFLEAQQQAPVEAFYEAARKLGIDPEKAPEEKRIEYRDPARPVRVRFSSGEFVEVQSAHHDLIRVVREAIDVEDYLSRHGRHMHGGKTECPMHEPLGGARSFTLHGASDLAPKIGYFHVRYRCWGDCQGSVRETGDVIDLHRHLRGMSRTQALYDLAREKGIDPEQYRARFRQREQELSVALLPKPDKELAGWVRIHAPEEGHGDSVKFLKALAYVLITAGAPAEVVAYSMAHGMGARLRYSEAFLTVGELQELIERQEDKKVVRGAWLRRQLGLRPMVHLNKITARLASKHVMETYKELVGTSPYARGTMERKRLIEWARSIPAPPPKQKKEQADELPSGGVPVHPDSRVRGMLRFPAGCGDFANQTWGDGVKLGEALITCGQLSVCPRCSGKHALNLYDMLTRQPTGPEDEFGEFSWTNRPGTFYAAWLTFDVPIAKCTDLLEHVGAHSEGQRIRSIGVTPEGKVRLLFVAQDEDAVYSAWNAGMNWAAIHEHAPPDEFARTDDPKVAAGWIVENFTSLAIYANDLVRRGDKDAMLAYLHWIKGKSVLKRSRGDECLPLPTRVDVRRYAKEVTPQELGATYEGQEVEHKAVHVSTGYVLGVAKYPYTINTVIALAIRHTGFLLHMEQVERKEAGQLQAAA